MKETVRNKGSLVCTESLPWPGAKLYFMGFQVARSQCELWPLLTWPQDQTSQKSSWAFWVKVIWPFGKSKGKCDISCVLTAATAPNSSSEPAAPCPRHYREMLFTGLLCSLCPIIVHPRQMAKGTGGFHPPGLSPSFAYSTVTKAWAAKGLTTHSTQERAQNEKGRE